MKTSCIIIEDEPLALERTRSYVEKITTLELLATFDNALDAFGFLKTQEVGLIFLDINLGELSGLQFLETTRVKSQVIITTAYSEYALRGFDLQVADYLVKPFAFERFLQAVDRAQSLIQPYSKDALKIPTTPTFIFVKTEYRLEKVALADLLYIEGMRDYRKIHLVGKAIMTLQTFSELEREIPSAIACRVHKSYMVALENIESIERDRIIIKNAGNVIIPISETYRQTFFEQIRATKK